MDSAALVERVRRNSQSIFAARAGGIRDRDRNVQGTAESDDYGGIMPNVPVLSNFKHPAVVAKAAELTDSKTGDKEKLASIFAFVRDEIRFGFPPNGDLTTASETLRLGMGQCNTKGTLFLALCKASSIPARLHFSLIDKDIQRGLFTGLAYWLMPPSLSHCWIEVRVDDQWHAIDSYINDEAFAQAGAAELARCGWDTGFSLACSGGPISTEFRLDRESFVQMDAVVKDQGVWDIPSRYYESSHYKNRLGWFRRLMYRLLIGRSNRRIRTLRNRIGQQANQYQVTTQPNSDLM